MLDRGLLPVDAMSAVTTAITACGAQGRYTIADVAQRLGTSPRTLQRRVRRSGHSVTDLIDTYRFERAKAVLAGPDTRLVDVAEQLGFDSERGFRKAFRRWAGMTAAQWRAQTSPVETPHQIRNQ